MVLNQNTTAWCRVEVRPLANSIRELGHEARLRIWSDAAAAQELALGSGSGGIKHMGIKFFWLQQKEKNQEPSIEKIRGTVNSADLMTKHLHGKRSTTLCGLLNIKHISGGTNSAPKLTIDTEYITDAKRAAMTLVR